MNATVLKTVLFRAVAQCKITKFQGEYQELSVVL